MQPPRTEAVADALFQGKLASSRDFMTLLVKAYLQQFQQWVDKASSAGSQLMPKDWHEHQKVVDREVGLVLSEASRTSNFSMDLPDWSVVTQKLGQHAAFSGLDVLFVFDEARELLAKTDDNGVNLFRYSGPGPTMCLCIDWRVCMCLCSQVCAYDVCMYNIHACTYVYTCILCVCVCVRVHVCVCIYVCVCLLMYTDEYVCNNMYVYIHRYICSGVHLQGSICEWYVCIPIHKCVCIRIMCVCIIASST
jgi:hypothetical protein